MDIITTHINADFDCLGAMVAAGKLYPGATMAFSGSQEKSLRDFFTKTGGYGLPLARIKELDLSLVTRLIIVDCQHSARIGRFADIVKRPGLEVLVYDHHTEVTGDFRPHGGMIRECGSTTTIIVRLLQEREISVSPEEATMMMLGIYEDTGNLTFLSTTRDDYLASAWLLDQGARLTEVSDAITQELTAAQVSLLNDLLKSLHTITINGVDIALAHASVDYYISDIAVLAHMMRDMENLQSLFLVVDMGNRVYVVARSQIPEVDAGELLRELGGGGHATAASATVKELTLFQVMNRLKELLRERVNPRRTIRELMSSPVIVLPDTSTLAGAQDLLVKYNINAMPVMHDEKMIGIISRRVVEKALFHDLGTLPVTEYMYTEFMRATPETPLAEVRDYIVGHNRRFVPVFQGEELAGAVTRTDLLRSLQKAITGDGAVRDLDGLPAHTRGLETIMIKTLPPQMLRLLKDLGKTGDELELPVYAVGGFVRDLLLGNQNTDVDITVEGDGILFAEAFAARYPCRVRSHTKFGTAVLVLNDGSKVDVASTRLEYYETPAALPTVERSSLRMDLSRRDFTINTLALRLNTPSFGTLVDFFGAQRDLRDRTIRVLHNLSFVEDPTRVFRAVRFEQRLRFKISAHTESLIKNAVKMNFLDKLGGKRLLTELIIILREKEPLQAVERMNSLGLLRFIHPRLQYSSEMKRVLGESLVMINWLQLLYLQSPTVEPWVVYLLALTMELTTEEIQSTVIRLALVEQNRHKFSESRHKGEEALGTLQKQYARHKSFSNSELYRLLHDLPLEVILHLMARTVVEDVRRALSTYVTHLRDVTCLVTGQDLKKLGIPQGPLYTRILEEIKGARLNGQAVTREDELRIAEKVWRKNKPVTKPDSQG